MLSFQKNKIEQRQKTCQNW